MKTLFILIFCVLPFIVFGQVGGFDSTLLIQNILTNNPNPNRYYIIEGVYGNKCWPNKVIFQPIQVFFNQL